MNTDISVRETGGSFELLAETSVDMDGASVTAVPTVIRFSRHKGVGSMIVHELPRALQLIYQHPSMEDARKVVNARPLPPASKPGPVLVRHNSRHRPGS
jgi:hypothetical protein